MSMPSSIFSEVAGSDHEQLIDMVDKKTPDSADTESEGADDDADFINSGNAFNVHELATVDVSAMFGDAEEEEQEQDDESRRKAGGKLKGACHNKYANDNKRDMLALAEEATSGAPCLPAFTYEPPPATQVDPRTLPHYAYACYY